MVYLSADSHKLTKHGYLYCTQTTKISSRYAFWEPRVHKNAFATGTSTRKTMESTALSQSLCGLGKKKEIRKKWRGKRNEREKSG